MGSRKIIKYTADVIDSVRSDWSISDDGDDRGPIDTWPAPFLGTDNGSNAVPARELRRSGARSGGRFDGHIGPIPPQIIPRRVTFFDDGGLNVEGRRRNFAADAFAKQRFHDAIFSRVAVGGDAYRFLRATDPGSDNTYAPRRGPHDVTSTSATNAGAGFIAFDDAGDIYSDIATYHQQTADLFRRWGFWNRLSPAQQNRLTVAFQNVQRDARTGNAWNAVGQAHQIAYDLARTGLNRSPSGPQAAELQAHFQRLSKAMPGGGGVLSDIGGTFVSIGKGVANVGGGLVKTVGGALLSPALLANDIAHGKNVFASLKDTVQRDLQSAKDLAPYAQAVLSVVPGVGQGVNAAIAAGNALAHGQPITEALVNGVKGMLPGGPIVQQALTTAYNIAKGQSVSESVLDAARSQIPEGPARAAFNTGIALAHGQKIQDLAKEQGMSFLGDQLTSRLSPIAGRALDGVGPRIGSIAQTAMSVVPTNVKQAAQALLNNPQLRSLPVQDLARRLNMPERDVQAGVASIVQAASRTGQGQMVRTLAPANAIAQRIGNASFDQTLSRFGSRMAPIAMGPNRTARRIVLPRFPHLMPGAMGLQEAGAFSTIKLGSSGADVQAWQRILGVTADGKFGPQTDAATRAWQRSHGLTADGVVGPKTWAAASGSTPQSPTGSGPGVTTIPEVVIAAAPPPPLTQGQIQAAASMPTIRMGSSGAAVQTWQGILQRDSGISMFPQGPLDGKFGPQTDAATRNWQRSSGLTADGVVGPNTWKKAIGSLTTAPLPAEKAPGVPLPTPVPPGLPPGLPPVPVQPASGPPPTLSTIPPITISQPPTPPIFLPPVIAPGGPGPGSPPSIGVTTPPPASPATDAKAGGAVAALAIGAIVAKMAGIF